MPVESSSGFLTSLDALSPDGTEGVNEGDNHLRAMKQILKNTFPNATAAINPTPSEFNYLVGVTSLIQPQIAAKGAIAGQTWTGTHNYQGATMTAATPITTAVGNEVATAAFVVAKTLGSPVTDIKFIVAAAAQHNALFNGAF